MKVNINYKNYKKSFKKEMNSIKIRLKNFESTFDNIKEKKEFYLNKRIAIETNKLWKKYGFKKKYALKNANLKIYEGDIHALIGRNGAGKTTLMKILVGAIWPSKGDAYIFSQKVSNINVKKYFGYVPEKDIFKNYPNTVHTFLKTFSLLNGIQNEEINKRINEVVNFMEIENLLTKKPKSFSSGQKKKVLIAQALLSRPKILILDEPTANLDPTIRMTILNKLKALVEKTNMTILISSHVLSELQDFVSGWTIINEGQILVNESFGNLFSNVINYSLITTNNSKTIEYLKNKYIIKNDVLNNRIYIYLSLQDNELNLFKTILELPITIISFKKEDKSLEYHFNNLLKEASK